MAGSERRSLSLRVLRASLVAAVVVGAAAACGSSGTNRRGGPLADPAAVQDPRGNPAAALLNGEVPLPNPEQPPAPAEAPLPNPEQPSSPSGAGPATGVVAAGGCPQVCVGLGGVCGSACLTSCGNLSAVSSCAALVSSLLVCVGRATLVCGPNGKINFANVTSCEDEGRAAVDCVMNIQNDTMPPVPGRGPPGN